MADADDKQVWKTPGSYPAPSNQPQALNSDPHDEGPYGQEVDTIAEQMYTPNRLDANAHDTPSGVNVPGTVATNSFVRRDITIDRKDAQGNYGDLGGKAKNMYEEGK